MEEKNETANETTGVGGQVEPIVIHSDDDYLKHKWKIDTCNAGAKCWCRMIILKDKAIDKRDNGDAPETIFISPSGCLPKNIARHIVKLHNKYLSKV